MHSIKHTLLAICFYTSSTLAFAQDSTGCDYVFGDGLSLHGGAGYFAVRDEFISNEKYSGTISSFAASWSRLHESYGFRIQCQYQFSSNLKNYNVSAELTQFSLNLDFLYPIGNTQLLSRNIYFYLGPTSELFIHFRRQNIAGSGGSVLNAYSFVMLISGGVKSEAYCPITSSFQLETAAQLSLLSFSGRIVNPVKSDESFFKLLTALNGLNTKGEVRTRYSFSDAWSIAIGYRLEVTRVSTWDYFISSCESFIASVSCNF
jgi:hypothetical protein